MDTSHWSQVSLPIRASLIKSSNPLLSPAFRQATPLPLRRPSEIAEDKAGASASRGAAAGDRRTRRTDDDRQLSCPRCNSSNTKFCYYNNYSLTQPRYFCKTCRRYWTEGGSLRNVPVGGGTRKNKRNYASASAPPISPKPSSNSNECVSSSMQNPNCVQGFNLGFHHHEGFSNMEIIGLHDGYRGFSHDTGLGLGFLPHGAQEHDVVLEESREQQGFWNGMIW